MKNSIQLIALCLLVWLGWACTEEFRLTAEAPSVEDANFNFQPTAESANIIQFTGAGDFFMMKWDLGNGATAEGRTVTGLYPLAGTYTVTLTVFNAGGSESFSRDIVIDETDPTLLDRPVFNLLTGGIDAVEGKTWVIDSTRVGHFGVGPNPSVNGDFPEFYQAQPNEKVGSGMYNTRYTFKLDSFQFIWNTGGLVYLNAAQGGQFPGAFDPGVGDLSAPFVSPGGLTWNIVEEAGRNPVLSVSSPGFIGYFAGGRTYQIVRLEENELFLRFVDQSDETLAWYVRLIPAGLTVVPDPEPEPEPEDPNVAFTLNDLVGPGKRTWMLRPGAGSFGVGPARGSEAFFPNGNDISGDRPCLWNDKFTFGRDGVFTYQAQGDIFAENYMGLGTEGCVSEELLAGTAAEAWGSGTHTFTFTPGTATEFPKLTVRGAGAFIALPKAFNGGEYSAAPPRADEAVTYEVIGYDPETRALSLSIDISTDGSVFWNFVLIPTSEEATGPQEPEAGAFTLQDLIGAGTRSWSLEPTVGAFGVGPGPGSDAFFPNGQNISGDRPCLWNDAFIFQADGTYRYDANGDVYAEDYMGIFGGGCQPESNLIGTPGAAWASGTHQFTFTPATGNTPAKITVTGTGAFIALPKAFNGGEYSEGPPRENASVTYTVLDYNPSTRALTLTLDITDNGSVWWTFRLIPND
ncbi:MAG: PKD domain-containing protein [Nitritalea sp.]